MIAKIKQALKNAAIVSLTIAINTQACEQIDLSQYANLDAQRAALQNARWDCEDLSNSIQLAKVFQQLGESRNANDVMQKAKNQNDAKTEQGAAKWLIASTEMALSAKQSCKANQHLNELQLYPNNASSYRELRKQLMQINQDQTIKAETIGCALTGTRSITVRNPKYRGMKIKPKLDIAIQFNHNSDTLTQQGKTQTQNLATALLSGSISEKTLTLIGHTDSTGTESYNLDLSQRRAQAVANYLVQINSSLRNRIDTIGKGETELLSYGTTDQDHQLNRRVEVQLN